MYEMYKLYESRQTTGNQEMRLLIFLFLLLSACSMPMPDFVTDDGSFVYLRGEIRPGKQGDDFSNWIDGPTASKLQAELVADLRDPHCLPTENCAVDPRLADDKAVESLQWANYVIVTFPTPCAAHPGQMCAGYQQEHELVVGAVAFSPVANPTDLSCCGPRISAFKHETIHYLQEMRLGVYDPNHTRPEWLFQ